MLPRFSPKWHSLISNSLKSLTISGCLLATVVTLPTANAQQPILPNTASIALYENLPFLKMAAQTTEEKKSAKENQTFESYLLSKLPEAKKVLADSCQLDDRTVGISLLERQSGEIFTVTMTKTDFLTAGYQEQYVLNNGAKVIVRIDQPNYVNTKLNVEADKGLFIPLTVKYPIVKQGVLKEMAYYTPAHRTLQQHSFAKMGDSYINKVLTDASATLKKQGFEIPADVVKVARMLCVIEHIDHDRYRKEESEALFKEVLTLYALNRGDCYRYSVSSAGAGGMVQMIGSTYREIKGSFPGVDLLPGFEAGMINHNNAAKAMLLYLNRYHEFYLNNTTSSNAIENGLCTKEELMAAGYNSNPVRVPGKLTRGENWKNALPRETQVYLSILRSLDSSVTTEPPRYHYAAEQEQYAVYRPNRSRRATSRSTRNKLKSHVRNSGRANKRVKSNKRSVIRSKATGKSHSAKKSGRARRR